MAGVALGGRNVGVPEQPTSEFDPFLPADLRPALVPGQAEHEIAGQTFARPFSSRLIALEILYPLTDVRVQVPPQPISRAHGNLPKSESSIRIPALRSSRFAISCLAREGGTSCPVVCANRYEARSQVGSANRCAAHFPVDSANRYAVRFQAVAGRLGQSAVAAAHRPGGFRDRSQRRFRVAPGPERNSREEFQKLAAWLAWLESPEWPASGAIRGLPGLQESRALPERSA